MKSVVTYIRGLLGWSDEDPVIRTSVKRDRTEDDFSSDDDSPALKRLKQLKRTSFPGAMASDDIWGKSEKQAKNVRYVPIQIEGLPSTSTPIEVADRSSRYRTVPMRLVSENGSSTPARRQQAHQPKHIIQAIVDDEDNEDVTWVENKPQLLKKPKQVIIDLEDDENEQDDVVFVKRVSTPPPVKPYQFFLSKNSDVRNSSRNGEPVQYYKLVKTLNSDKSSLSPRSISKFKSPPGITKSYKKAPAPVPRWMQPQKSPSISGSRSRLHNGSTRSTLTEVFNLDEKRNYQELIRRVVSSGKPVSFSKQGDIINLAQESASFRNTQRSQRRALDEIKFAEKGLNAEKEIEFKQEYDPITVASINSSDSEVEVVPSESSSSSIRIDPVNSLRASFKSVAVTSDDWLTKLDSKYRKKKEDIRDKLIDARRESDIISKVNSEQKLAHLEHKLKYELSIPESLFEEPQPTVELPPLTPEQEKLVNRVLGPGPPGQLLVEKFNLRIHRRDLQTLAGLNWLNDEVINFYMNLLMQRSEERKDLPKVYATNTFFYPKLMQSGQAGLRRWTRKIDIFAHDLMVVPVHLGVHWCVSLIFFKEKKINYLDSMGGRNQGCLDALKKYLHDEHKDKKGQPFDDKGWKTECLKDIPQQMNGSDCGMFSCTFAEFSSRNAPYTFNQSHMPYLRRKAALEILQGRLLL